MNHKIKIDDHAQTIFIDFKEKEMTIEISRLVPRDQNIVSKEIALQIAHAVIDFYEKPYFE